MIYLKSFLFAGFICALAQFILDKFKLTPGHITCLFVIVGSFLDIFSIYDKLVVYFGGGALVPITSFGHMLCHATVKSFHDSGFLGLITGTFNLTSAGITAAIVCAFYFSLIFKPKD